MTNEVTVLVVDDQKSIYSLVREILRRAGYAVLTAASGEEAMAIFYEKGSYIRCVITDCRMPGMSGQQLAERLLSLRPELSVIFMSGSEPGLAGYPLLRKPFTPTQLIERIRDAIPETRHGKGAKTYIPKPAGRYPERASSRSTGSHRRNVHSLTPRETEVLALLAQGYSTRRAADQLGISFKTAASHRLHIYDKLNVHGVVSLLRYAIRMGLVDA